MKKLFSVISFAIFLFFITDYLDAQTLDNKKQDQYIKVTDDIVRTALRDNLGYEILGELCKIGPRLSGSDNSLKSIYWAKNKMVSLGLKNITLQPVMVPKWTRGSAEECQIIKSGKFQNRNLKIAALGGSIPTGKDGIVAQVIEVHDFVELKSLGEKVKGKIVFFNRAMDASQINTFSAYGGAVNQRAEGPARAAEVGAAAVIVRSVTTKNDNVPHTGTLQYDEKIPKIPAAAIGIKDAVFLSDALKKDPDLKIKMILSCENHPETESFNVFGDLIGSEKPEEVIFICGHFDSWDVGEGAHDDGAGCIQGLEVISLFKRLGLKPKRTIRSAFVINEENGLRGGIAYGKYADTSREKHLAAIESDRGAFTPRGFYIDSDSLKVKKIASWLSILQKSLIEWVLPGGSGADISRIKAKALIGFVPDIQRYFDYHHSGNDIFSEVHQREFELGSAAIAILVYLLSEEGL